MQYSISNIGWAQKYDEAVYELMQRYGFTGLDVAPGRVLSNLQIISQEEVEAFKSTVQKHGLQLAGIQSLLFKRPELAIFGDEETSENTKDVLKGMIDLGQVLDVSAVVFGSPKNRIMGTATPEKWERARSFFKELGEYAEERGMIFCLEPNPTMYGGDFLTGTEETIAFIRDVGAPGLKLNLDTGTLIANNELLDGLIERNIDVIGHVHLSVPYLKPFQISEVHKSVLTALKEVGYTGWVAIEVAAVEEAEQLQVVETMLRELREVVDVYVLPTD